MRWNNKCNVDNKLENPTPYTCYIRQNWLVVKTPVICAGVLDLKQRSRLFETAKDFSSFCANTGNCFQKSHI